MMDNMAKTMVVAFSGYRNAGKKLFLLYY